MSERPAPPTTADLAELLGPTADLWTRLRGAVDTRFSPVKERWVYGGRNYGWSCRLERGKKGILYITPGAGHFRVGLALSDVAREAALASDLPAETRAAIAAATKVMEGWPVRMAVRTAADVEVALKLAEIKLSS